MASLALELSISETTLRRWVRMDDRRQGFGRDPRAEIELLRRQVSQLSVEVELLKRATAGVPFDRVGRSY